MIKHIVIWKLKPEPGVTGQEVNAKRLKKEIEALRDSISEIKHIEVGINIAASDQAGDLVLYSEFDSLTDLDIYQNHPDHQKVVELVRELTIERRVVDYEY